MIARVNSIILSDLKNYGRRFCSGFRSYEEEKERDQKFINLYMKYLGKLTNFIHNRFLTKHFQQD